MRSASLLLCFVWLATQATGQTTARTASLDRQLDSILQIAPVFGKTAIIYRSGNKIRVDTIRLSRYKLSGSDSSILFKGRDKSQLRIAARDLWGMTSDYGERRRFYNGKALSIYKASAPYVYKVEGGLTVYYYFSETPCGRIYPLTNELIDQEIVNDYNRSRLYDFMRLHQISGSSLNRKQAYEFLATTADVFITISITFTGEILKSLLLSLTE